MEIHYLTSMHGLMLIQNISAAMEEKVCLQIYLVDYLNRIKSKKDNK